MKNMDKFVLAASLLLTIGLNASQDSQAVGSSLAVRTSFMARLARTAHRVSSFGSSSSLKLAGAVALTGGLCKVGANTSLGHRLSYDLSRFLHSDRLNFALFKLSPKLQHGLVFNKVLNGDGMRLLEPIGDTLITAAKKSAIAHAGFELINKLSSGASDPKRNIVLHDE